MFCLFVDLIGCVGTIADAGSAACADWTMSKKVPGTFTNYTFFNCDALNRVKVEVPVICGVLKCLLGVRRGGVVLTRSEEWRSSAYSQCGVVFTMGRRVWE